MAAPAVLLITALLVGACASEQEPEVQRVAVSFLRAIQDGDGAGACALLAPETRRKVVQSAGAACEAAVMQEELANGTGPSSEPGSVRVFGRSAQVVLASDTLFLGQFSGGWRVTAASCTPRGDRPYECQVQGG